MISGLCGFAELIRSDGGEVGAAELIDVARSFTLIDLADRSAVERAVRINVSWSAVEPERFDELFDRWFGGVDLETVPTPAAHADDTAVAELEAETVEAARIHVEDSLTIEDRRDGIDEATAEDGERGRTPSPAQASGDGGLPTGAYGDPAPVRPAEETADLAAREVEITIALPETPAGAELELARGALASALDRRRLGVGAAAIPARVTALTAPLTSSERDRLVRFARQIDRNLRGAPSWRRRAAATGSIDLRRTMRRTVTTGGLPIDVRNRGRRHDAARLVVLVDVSLSVRGTSRLVLHLLHRMRSSVGSLRAFGFVDSLVPIDRALRTSDPVEAIEGVFGAVDVQANSDPGRALRAWLSRWHALVTPETHVLILSDGRCNGNDPAYDVVRSVTTRSASTVWVSPEPVGAWSLGRGEMERYAASVDDAVTVRSIDDLDALSGLGRPSRRRGRPSQG